MTEEYAFDDVRKYLETIPIENWRPHKNGIGIYYQVSTPFGSVVLMHSMGPLMELHSEDNETIGSFNQSTTTFPQFYDNLTQRIKSVVEQRRRKNKLELRLCLEGRINHDDKTTFKSSLGEEH